MNCFTKSGSGFFFRDFNFWYWVKIKNSEEKTSEKDFRGFRVFDLAGSICLFMPGETKPRFYIYPCVHYYVSKDHLFIIFLSCNRSQLNYIAEWWEKAAFIFLYFFIFSVVTEGKHYKNLENKENQIVIKIFHRRFLHQSVETQTGRQTEISKLNVNWTLTVLLLSMKTFNTFQNV